MEETGEKREGKNYQDVENARLGYQTAVRLFTLGSQEFYSRFAAMLIVHGLLLTVVFRYPTIDKSFAILASSAGIALCFLGWLIALQSFQCQSYYNKIIKRLEKSHFKDSFSIFYSDKYPDKDLPYIISREDKCPERKILRVISVECCFRIIIGIFVVVYLVMFFKIISNCA
jgi:hypothetical protein